jgi:thioredoxin 1
LCWPAKKRQFEKILELLSDCSLFFSQTHGKDVTMKKGILEIDDRTFDSQVLQSDSPVLVDLWAPWCGPCNSIEPVVEKLAGAYGDQIQFTRCNVDHNPKTPAKYGVKGIPALMFFKEGKLVDKLTGLVPKSIIEDAIKNCLA